MSPLLHDNGENDDDVDDDNDDDGRNEPKIYDSQRLKHFKAMLTPQTFQSHANASNISKQC